MASFELMFVARSVFKTILLLLVVVFLFFFINVFLGFDLFNCCCWSKKTVFVIMIVKQNISCQNYSSFVPLPMLDRMSEDDLVVLGVGSARTCASSTHSSFFLCFWFSFSFLCFWSHFLYSLFH